MYVTCMLHILDALYNIQFVDLPKKSLHTDHLSYPIEIIDWLLLSSTSAGDNDKYFTFHSE